LGILCHELGHQCGAAHTFNATALAGCQNNRNAATAWEVGSGSTIMAYPGICDTDNVVTGFDLRFHAGSLEQIGSYLATGGGAFCVSLAATGNTPPVVSAGAPLTIPRDTPFQLTATGSDADGDALTYAWEQFDAGGSFINPPYGDQPSDPPTTTRPLFRPMPPTASPTRIFPSLPFILNHANLPPEFVNGLRTGENLPSVTRDLRFRVTARDNRAGGGGVNQAEVVVTVHGPAGPFRVNNVTGVWAAGSQQAVTWAVAGTDQPPINCSTVNIALSYDGGLTFTTLAASRPNTGLAMILVPSTAPNTTQARLRVEAANGTGISGGNTFFDITDANFTIAQTSAPPRLTTVGMFRPSNGFFYLRYSNTPGFADTDFFYGLAADVPIIGDWNGDGIETIGIFRNGEFFLRNSNTAGFADVPAFSLGGVQPGDIPLSGDWDGNGVATVGVFRAGLFLLRNSNTSGAPDVVVAYGGGDDLPIVGDWDGNRTDTIGVYRGGVFFLRNNNSAGLPDIEAAFGAAGDTPLAGDWNGDGVDTIGVFRVSEQQAQFFLSPANVSGPLPPPVNYGLPTDRPVVGKWQ
ncbi:MAG: reprolysin-like metallopeptidase, partial [Chloracidobacterium sp.]